MMTRIQFRRESRHARSLKPPRSALPDHHGRDEVVPDLFFVFP
jgi:hypothetical protein